MTEDEIKQQIRQHLGLRPDIKLFTNPVGNGWMGEPKHGSGYVHIKNPRRIEFGLCVGSSDLIGWAIRDGRAVFLAVEVKTKYKKPTPAQENFIAQVKAAGGIAGVVRSIEDVEALLHT